MATARRFLVVGHTQRTTPPIPANDPAGAGGRWDLLARCVTSALLVSHGVRRDTEIALVLRGPPPRTLRLRGDEVRGLNPDERSTVAFLARALESQPVGTHEERVSPGFYVSARGLDAALDEAPRTGEVFWLHEAATKDVSDLPASPERTFVLSDHQEFTADESELLGRREIPRVRLGPVVLQADQAIVIAHHWLDRR